MINIFWTVIIIELKNNIVVSLQLFANKVEFKKKYWCEIFNMAIVWFSVKLIFKKIIKFDGICKQLLNSNSQKQELCFARFRKH